MADVSKVKIGQNVFDVKDETARKSIPSKVSQLDNDEGYLKEHQSLDGYMPLAGGAMTGPISYKGSKATYSMVRWIDNTADAGGNGVSIGGGGTTLLGGGESASAVEGTLTTGGDEKLILSNDGEIDFYTNVENGIASATHTTIDKDGVFSGKVEWANVQNKPTLLDSSTSQKANTVYASPDGKDGAGSFRALTAGDIPSLSADKITSGTLASDRIPNISAIKVTSGTLDIDRIPQITDDKIESLSASKITGELSSSQLPSYVDDVLEGYVSSDGAIFYKTKGSDGSLSNAYDAEDGKIYVDLDSNKTYRWSGSQYIVISDTIALGETANTAYRGDLGKVAYDHSQAKGNPHGTTKADLSLGNVENKSSETIRGEITSANVTKALGFTPADSSALSGYLPLSGGTLTGNLTGQHITGTWLQTTAVSRNSSTVNNIAVIDERGWIYYRTLEDIKNDMGAASADSVYSSTENRTANTVLAAPSGSDGAATFRALTADDIPSIPKSKISDFPTSMPASDVKAWAKSDSKPSYSASEVGAVPTSRTINKKPLTSDVTISASDIGATAKTSTTISIAASAWSSNKATVTVSGVTASNDIIVSPAPDSYSAYGSAGIYASAQAANSVTFTCSTAPSATVSVNVMIFG